MKETEEKRLNDIIEILDKHTDDYIDKKWQEVNNKINKKKNIVFINRMITGIAASFLLLGAGIWFFNNSNRQETWNKITAFSDEFIYLPDSTEVFLSKNSVLEYSSFYGQKNRNVKLIGSALFDVKRNEKVPFLVLADSMKVKVLGTKFSVMNDKKRNFYSTTLLRGKVEVCLDENEEKFILSPDDRLTYSPGLISPTVTKIDSDLWESGLENKPIRISNKSLKEVTELLSAKYKIVIKFENPEYQNKYISLTLKNQEIDEVMDAISNLLGLYYSKSQDGIITIH